MKIVPISSLAQLERTHHARKGKFLFHQLREGDENAPDNFSLQLVKTFGDFYSPRHRHNFDQIRVQIEGECDFTRDGLMRPGAVAYFPESTPYGPQKNAGEALVLVLQFGGASGNGYISERMYHQTIGELKKTGEFRDGFYIPAGASDGRDAFEAVWEAVNRRKIDYSPQRYAAPVFMDPSAFGWSRCPGAVDAEVKPLGTFTERRVGIKLVRLKPGGRVALDGRALVFVVRGGGRVGQTEIARHDTIDVEAGEQAAIVASADLEILVIDLPPLAGNHRQTRESVSGERVSA